MSQITSQEVAEQLRRAVNGEVTVTLAMWESSTWDEIYCGNVSFMVGDWTIVFFNDCDEMDYVDHATAPDGRTADYGDLAGSDPLDDILTAEEFMALERLLGEAR